jgi:HSP20 family protein
MPKNSTEIIKTRSQWGSSQDIHFRISKKPRQWMDRPHLWHPPTDLLESEKSYVVRLEIAGMEHAEMTISLEGSALAIYGTRQQETETAAYYQMEIRFGEFLSIVDLPGSVDAEQITVSYSDGFLHVSLPKAEL